MRTQIGVVGHLGQKMNVKMLILVTDRRYVDLCGSGACHDRLGSTIGQAHYSRGVIFRQIGKCLAVRSGPNENVTRTNWVVNDDDPIAVTINKNILIQVTKDASA